MCVFIWTLKKYCEKAFLRSTTWCVEYSARFERFHLVKVFLHWSKGWVYPSWWRRGWVRWWWRDLMLRTTFLRLTTWCVDCSPLFEWYHNFKDVGHIFMMSDWKWQERRVLFWVWLKPSREDVLVVVFFLWHPNSKFPQVEVKPPDEHSKWGPENLPNWSQGGITDHVSDQSQSPQNGDKDKDHQGWSGNDVSNHLLNELRPCFQLILHVLKVTHAVRVQSRLCVHCVGWDNVTIWDIFACIFLYCVG